MLIHRRITKKLSILMAMAVCLGILMLGAPTMAEEGPDTYTQSTITYITPSWTNRANKIGTAAITPEDLTTSGFENLYVEDWAIDSSTMDLSMAYDYQASFSTTYTGYQDILFIAEMPVGFILSVQAGEQMIKLAYIMDYDENTGVYKPIGGQGYLTVTGAEGQLVDISQSAIDRSKGPELEATFKSSTVSHEQLSASFTDIGAEGVAFSLLDYAWVLNMTQKHDLVVAQVGGEAAATVTYGVTVEMPARFIDELKRSATNQNITDTTFKITVAPTFDSIMAVQYKVDYTVEVLDVKDNTVKAGKTATFQSSVKAESKGTVADDEVSYGLSSYFELSTDGGTTWNKVEGSDNQDSIDVDAMPQKNGYLYRNVVVAGNDEETKVISKAGKLNVISYNVTFNKNTKNAVENMPADIHGALPDMPVEAPQETPAQSGYTFTGWYTDSNASSPWSFSTPLEGDLVLYAGWQRGGGFTPGEIIPPRGTITSKTPEPENLDETPIPEIEEIINTDYIDAPKTGDPGSPWLWLGTLLSAFALCGCAVRLLIGRRKYNTKV